MSSQITIVNNASNGELVRVAIYKRSTPTPLLSTVAWQIVAPPSGGQTVVPIPDEYQIYCQYSNDPNTPNITALPLAAVNYTNTVSFLQTTALFTINTLKSQDSKATSAQISQQFTGLQANEVRLENHFSQGVLSHIMKDNADIFAPQVLWPGAVRIESVLSTLYLAVVSQFVFQGNQLMDEEIQLTETPILEGGTAVVTGNMWAGYSISTSN